MTGHHYSRVTWNDCKTQLNATVNKGERLASATAGTRLREGLQEDALLPWPHMQLKEASVPAFTKKDSHKGKIAFTYS